MLAILSLVLLSLGVALVVSRFFSRRETDREFPRPEAPPRHRAIPLLAGVLMAAAGLAGWLLSPGYTP
jgi:hypothetical protein